MDALTQALQTLATPCYVVDEAKLESNLRILKSVADEAGCKILLAQKAFSMFSAYPLIGKYLAGTAASGLYEARLGREEMGGEVHVFSPPIPTANLKKSSGMPTISYSIPLHSGKSSKKKRWLRASAAACA